LSRQQAADSRLIFGIGTKRMARRETLMDAQRRLESHPAQPLPTSLEWISFVPMRTRPVPPLSEAARAPSRAPTRSLLGAHQPFEPLPEDPAATLETAVRAAIAAGTTPGSIRARVEAALETYRRHG
jgi:hypothetical protein